MQKSSENRFCRSKNDQNLLKQLAGQVMASYYDPDDCDHL